VPIVIQTFIRYLQSDVLAQQLVAIPVEVAVCLAAVSPLAASGALLQRSHVLVCCAGVAWRVVAALGVLNSSLEAFEGIGQFLLCKMVNGRDKMA
jgi:hypothetical protein